MRDTGKVYSYCKCMGENGNMYFTVMFNDKSIYEEVMFHIELLRRH